MADEPPLPISLFVISDDGIPRQALIHLLNGQSDYKVVGESSIAAAKAAVGQVGPAVALINVGSAGARVLGLVEFLKTRNIPVVMLLRYSSAWLVRAYHAAGAIGFVLVQSNQSDLFRAIGSAAQRRPFVDPCLSDAVLELAPDPSREESRELSKREAQVLKYLAYGFNNAQVAQKLNVSTKSVETYRARLMGKLRLKSRTDLVRFALMTGILNGGHLDADMAS